LDGLEEGASEIGIAVVVDAEGVYVGDLLVEEPLAGADVSDASEEFVEVVLTDGATGFDALVVEGEALVRSSERRVVAH
jgi:hypothetical protein